MTLGAIASIRQVHWHRIAWIATFAFFLLNTGRCDRHRPLVCNPLILETCTP